MINIKYITELANQILENKKYNVIIQNEVSIVSEDSEFYAYKDNYIEIIKAKNTKALCVKIYSPLTKNNSNYVICINDEGETYDTNNEYVFFQLYAEKLLKIQNNNLIITESGRQKQQLIDSLFKEVM